MTEAKTLYLDTKPLRYLWKLHLGHWSNSTHSGRVNTKTLQEMLESAESSGTARILTSAFTVAETIQFEVGHQYSLLRLKRDDDPREILQEWWRPEKRWKNAPDLPEVILPEVRKELEKWISKACPYIFVADFTKEPSWVVPFDTASVLAFATWITLFSTIDARDAIHVSYALKVGDGFLTSDEVLKETIKNENLTGNDELRQIYEELFGSPPPSKTEWLDLFHFPKDLDRLKSWLA